MCIRDRSKSRTAQELALAYGVRVACHRFGLTALVCLGVCGVVMLKAPASWTHSMRFASKSRTAPELALAYGVRVACHRFGLTVLVCLGVCGVVMLKAPASWTHSIR